MNNDSLATGFAGSCKIISSTVVAHWSVSDTNILQGLLFNKMGLDNDFRAYHGRDSMCTGSSPQQPWCNLPSIPKRRRSERGKKSSVLPLLHGKALLFAL